MIKRIIIIFAALCLSSGCQTGSKNFKTNLKKKMLLNGIEVLSFKDKTLPSFQVILWSPQGSAYEPKGEQGVTNLMADLLIEGSEESTKEDLISSFSKIGSSFGSSVMDDQIIFSAQSLTEDSLELLKLFTEVTLSPKFSNRSILNLKGKIAANLKRVSDNPKALSAIAFAQTMYQDHGYAKVSSGTLASLPSIRRDAILKRYDQMMETSKLKIAFIGNWSEDAEAYMLSRYTDLEKGVEETLLDRVDVPEKTKESLLFHKRDLKQANVVMGFSAIPRSSQDYEALKVGLFVLGGSFKSRLNKELRVKRGLTYGVYSSSQAKYDGGVIKVAGGVRHDKVYEFITEAKKIIEDTAANGITQAELDKAKAIMRGQFPRGVETKEKEASTYLDLMSRGVEGEELYIYLNKILDLKLVDVNDALRKYLVMGRLNTIVLANKYKIPKNDLKKLGLKVKSYSKIKL